MSKHLPIILPPLKLDAVLDGRCTQVRVPLIPQPADYVDAFYGPTPYRKGFQPYVYGLTSASEDRRTYPEIHCPYGKRGDLLYVQEPWSTIGATSQDLILQATTPEGLFTDRNKCKPWQPAATMPKAAARLWLRVTSIDLHRAQLITRAGALAEGPVPMPEHDQPGFAPAYQNMHGAEVNPFVYGERIAFKQWFIEAYGRDAWTKNQWLWAVSFERTNSPLTLSQQ